jgi:8-oxo-dGTP diphosphatase
MYPFHFPAYFREHLRIQPVHKFNKRMNDLRYIYQMITVTCAIIENGGRVLCAQRSELMNLPMKWEFPGGKVEAGEEPEECLKREIREELGVEIIIVERLISNIHTYPDQKSFELIPFRCRLAGGKLDVKEHKLVKWLKRADLRELDWAEADIPVLNHYLANYR